VPRPAVVLEDALDATVLHLPNAICDGAPETTGFGGDETPTVVATAAGVGIREGSYFVGKNTALMQMVDGTAVIIPVKKGRNADGVFAKHARIIRKLIPIRDAVREILKCQETDQPWKQAQVRLRIAWSSFVRDFGPINTTVVSSLEDEESGEVRETHRRPNLAPFADDPDCWLVASIEDYDLETNTARPGPIFTERVIAPPPAPVIASAADALAVVLNERGTVDPDHIAELLHRGVDDVIGELGDAIFRDPATGAWHTAEARYSGSRCGARSGLCSQCRSPQARPAGRPSSIRHHGAAWRPVDSRRRHRRLREGDDGCRHHHPPHARTRLLDRECAATRMERRRHHRLGHPSSPRRAPAVGRAQLVDPADLRHGQGRRQ
jgi:N12 class adenine-specific DNA methylase